MVAFVGLTVRIEGVFDVWIHTYKDTLLFKLFYELDDVVFLGVVSVRADVDAVVVVLVIVATVVVVVIFAAIAVLIVAATEVAERP